MISLLMLLNMLDGVKSADLVLSLIILVNGKATQSSCCVSRPTYEKDPRNQGSSKFGRQLVQEEQLERMSPGDNPRELGIPGSNACLLLSSISFSSFFSF